MAVTLTLVSGNLTSGRANAQDEQPAQETANISEQEIVGTVRDAILSPLHKNIKESASTDSGKFLSKLVDAYGLDRLPDKNDPRAGLVDMVPDIKAINEKAMSMPLFEAGKTINDKEIAVFYYDFLKRTGWDISAVEGNIR